MNKLLKFSSVLLVFLVSSELIAQTGNTCAEAIPIAVVVNDCSLEPISNNGVTNSGQVPGCPLGSTYAGGDIWFEITLPPSGQAVFSSRGTVVDIPGIFADYNLALYSGTCGSLSLVDCDDSSSGAGDYPEIEINGSSGEVFYIQMWRANTPNPSNIFEVCAEGTATCSQPTAQFKVQCAGENQYEVVVGISNVGGGATPLTISNDAGVPATTGITTTGDYIIGPFPLGLDVQVVIEHVNDNTCDVSYNASSSGLGCVLNIGCGVVYTESYCYGNNDNSQFGYTTDEVSNVTLTFNSGLIQSPQDEILIYNGDPMTGVLLYQGSNGGDLAGLSFTANSGTLFMVVSSNAGGSCFDNSLGLGGGWEWEVECDGLSQCEAAETIFSQTTFDDSEQDYDLSIETSSGFDECDGTGLNADKWLTFTAVGNVQYFRAQGGATFDPVIEVYDACFGTQLACENTTGPGETEFFWLTGLNVGQDYKIRVYHEGSSLLEDPVISVAVRHIPIIQLRDEFCGVTDITSSDLIIANQPNPVDNSIQRFQFEFTDTGTGIVYGPYDMVGSGYDPTLPNFFMSQFSEILFGATFDVRVRVEMYAGPNFGEWGPACSLTTASDFQTSMEDQFDGDSYQLCQVVRAFPVGGASQYRWVFENTSTNEIHTVTRNSRSLRLDNVQPTLDMEASYNVDVFATVNGFENSDSDTKGIQTDPVPETELLNFFFNCGDNVGINQWTFADNVCGASSYTFRFTNQDGVQPPFTVVRPMRFIVFNMASQIQPGDTYDVDVFATINDIDGDYGPSCALTIGSAPSGLVTNPDREIEDHAANLTLYPNPVQNGGEISIVIENLDTTSENIQIEIFDLSGKRVWMQNTSGSGKVIERLQLDDFLSRGIYLVQTRIGGVLIESEKLFVQ